MNSEKWNIDALNVHLNKIMDERDKSYQQRWEAQEKALAAASTAAKEAVAQALAAAEKATLAAFNAQEKSVATAFNAQEKAVASALSAAERAVSKAEMASEKRFDAINDKIESNAVILDKFDLNTKSLVNKMEDLREYRDMSAGKTKGLNTSWGYLLAIVSTVVAIVMAFKK